MDCIIHMNFCISYIVIQVPLRGTAAAVALFDVRMSVTTV